MYNYESRGGSSDFWLLTSDFQLQTSDFWLPALNFRLHTSNFRLDKVRTPDFWSLTAQTQSWVARPSDLPLSTFHFPLPISDFRLPTSDFQLPISHFWVLTSDFWLDSQFAGINAQIQSSVERTAVPFSPQKRTTKLALEKATKHKANPATDEVRLENRNHGLAWSLIQLLIQKTITREGNTRSSQKNRKTLSWNILRHNAILHSWCSFILSFTSFL